MAVEGNSGVLKNNAHSDCAQAVTSRDNFLEFREFPTSS